MHTHTRARVQTHTHLTGESNGLCLLYIHKRGRDKIKYSSHIQNSQKNYFNFFKKVGFHESENVCTANSNAVQQRTQLTE